MKHKWILLSLIASIAVIGLFAWFVWSLVPKGEMGAAFEEAFEREVREFEQRDLTRPPVLGEAVPGEAWEHYRRGLSLYRELEQEAGEAALGVWGRDPDSPIQGELAAYLDGFRRSLQGGDLAGLIRHSRAGIPRDPEPEQGSKGFFSSWFKR